MTYTAADYCVRSQASPPKTFSTSPSGAARPKAMEVAPACSTWAAQLHVFPEGVWTTFVIAHTNKLLEDLELHPACATREHAPAQAHTGSRAPFSSGPPSDCPVRYRECQSASFFARPGPIYTALLNPPTSLQTDQPQVREKAQAPDSGRTLRLVRSPSEEATHVRNALRVLQCLESSGGPPSWAEPPGWTALKVAKSGQDCFELRRDPASARMHMLAGSAEGGQ